MKFKTLNNCVICNRPEIQHNTSLGVFTIGYGFHHWIRPGLELKKKRMTSEMKQHLQSKVK